jgi:stage V sporulation protein B
MSNNQNEKNTVLIQGTILAVASLVVRLIGLLYRVPMTRIIGESGIGYYSTAYQVYNVILLLSSYSMPQAVSKLMAMRLGKRQYRNANRYFLCSLAVSAASGLLFGAIMYFGANFIAGTMLHAELAAYSIRMLAPTVFVMGFLGVFRGFFQGFRNMVPTAISQIVEQIINAVVSVLAAYLLYKRGMKTDLVKGSTEYSAALGAMGGTVGTLAGALAALALILFLFAVSYPGLRSKMKKEPANRVFRYERVFSDIFQMVIPIVISTFIFHILNLIDNGIYGAYMSHIDVDEKTYMAVWGVYSGKYQLLINLPIALATALASSIIPELTRAVERKDRGEISQKIDISVRFTTLITIPAMIGLAVLGGDLVALLFGSGTSAADAGKMLIYGALAVLFFAYATISNGILHGLGRMFTTVRNALIALGVHLVVLLLSLWVMGWNIDGVVFSYTVFGFVVSVLNYCSIVEATSFRGSFMKTYWLPLAASALMGVCVYVINLLFSKGLGVIIHHASIVRLVSVCVSVVVGVVVYFAAILALHGVDEMDLLDMPMGTRLIRLAKRMHLLRDAQ